MNKEAIEMLEKILKKDLSMLTSVDKGFLKARRSYLTDEQLEKYASILDIGTTGEKKQKPKKEVVESAPEIKEVGGELVEVKPAVKFADLLAKGQRMGLKVRIGMKREEVEALIAEAEAQGITDKPAESPNIE